MKQIFIRKISRAAFYVLPTLASAITAAAAVGQPPQAFVVEHRAQASRALGYALGVQNGGICAKADIKRASDLVRDILAVYKFSPHASGTDAIARGIRQGKAEVAADMRKPKLHCERLEETLSVWRSYVLPPITQDR